MKLVYIAGPYTAPTRWEIAENIHNASKWARFVTAIGLVAITPHRLGHDFEDVQPPKYWYDATMELCRRCDGILMIPGWDRSIGAQAELAAMIVRGRPQFFVGDDDALTRELVAFRDQP